MAPDETTLHVRNAAGGDAESVGWLVERFTPLLVAQARYRLGSRMQRVVDAEDVVADVWIVALSRLGTLPERDGRLTPVVLKFLATTLLFHVNNLVKKHARGGALTGDTPLGQLPAESTRVVSRMVRHERSRSAVDALDQLSDSDREVVVLRAIEQHPNHEAAKLLGVEPNTLAVRYKRALARLRERLPRSVFDELSE